MQEAAETGVEVTPIRPPAGGRGGAPTPQDGGVPPELDELLLPDPELELLLLDPELELLELPLPAVPLLLELLDPELELEDDELELLELELDDELELELLELELEDELELELLELELEDELELLELEELLVELCPEFPWPLDPPSNIITAMASCEGRVTPSTRPGISTGWVTSVSTNSLLPL